MSKKPTKVHTRALALAYGLFAAVPASAQISIDFPTDFAGFSSQDLKVTIANIIQILIGFLGILVVILILAGGLKWMTSGGNEDKIAEAKKLISSAIVGLTLMLISYALANFVVTSLQQAV